MQKRPRKGGSHVHRHCGRDRHDKEDRKGTSSGRLTIEADKVLQGSKIGDSIAVNGVCLTITGMSGHLFTADVMAETIRRSNLGTLSSGSKVNLERAMAADGRFGGHIVSGHIDGTCGDHRLHREENAIWVTVTCDKKAVKVYHREGIDRDRWNQPDGCLCR